MTVAAKVEAGQTWRRLGDGDSLCLRVLSVEGYVAHVVFGRDEEPRYVPLAWLTTKCELVRQ